MTKTPTPDGAEMGERLRLVRSATIPPARDLQVARTERSPGFGRAARLPGFPVALSRYVLPVTVAGPRRTRTGFRESPFAWTTELSLGRRRSLRKSHQLSAISRQERRWLMADGRRLTAFVSGRPRAPRRTRRPPARR